jgi:hypothetical protein
VGEFSTAIFLILVYFTKVFTWRYKMIKRSKAQTNQKKPKLVLADNLCIV